MTSRDIGRLAEEIVIGHETVNYDCPFKIVRDVTGNFELGYDIEIYENGLTKERFKAIEVKAWSKNGYFFVSENEVFKLNQLGKAAWIYLVDIKSGRIVKKINDPFSNVDNLKPTNFKYFY